MSISAGDGKSPVFSWQMRVITPCEKRPCSSSTTESIAPAQSLQTALHRAFGTAATFTSIRYSSEPLTIAVTAPGAICRSTTDPLRT